MEVQNCVSASAEWTESATRRRRKAKKKKATSTPMQGVRTQDINTQESKKQDMKTQKKRVIPTKRHVQPVRSEPRTRKLTFLHLPPEVRNMIYSYAISTPTCIALFTKNTDPAIPQACRACNAFPRTLTITDYPRLPYPQRQRLSERQNQPPSFPCKSLTKWKTSVTGIHLTNKVISHESIMYIYDSLELRLRESSLLRKVFDTVPTCNLSFLKKLRFIHQTYGEPHQLDHVKWKTRADASWSKLVQDIITNMPNLVSLTLTLFVSDIPFRLNFRENWIQPLLQMDKFTELKSLKIEVQSRVRRGKKADAKESNTAKAQNQATVIERAHVLFELALADRIQGATDDDALKEYREYVDHLDQVTPHVNGGYGVREVMHWLK